MHTSIQKNLQDLLRDRGYLTVLEPPFDNRNADVLVQDPETMKTTIIEIELHKNYQHAFCSLNSDLKYADQVIVICANDIIRKTLSQLSIRLHHKNQQRIIFVLKNHYIEFIRTLFQNKNNNKIPNKTQNKVRINLWSELKKEVTNKHRKHRVIHCTKKENKMKIEKIQEKIHRPKTQEQLGVLILDGSESMAAKDANGEVKATSVARATKELIQRLRTSRRKDELFLSIIAFDTNVELRQAPTPVSEIDIEMDLDPMANHGGMTAIGDALDLGHQVVQGFLQNEQEGLSRNAVIILLSDGCSNTGTHDPQTIARKIHKNSDIIIATAAYGDDADKDLLREIASDPDKYYSEPDNGDELRDYFLSSIESVARV